MAKNIARAMQLRSGKSYLERAIQHLYPMELSCDVSKEKKDLANTYCPPDERRPFRKAAELAKLLIKEQAEQEDEVP